MRRLGLLCATAMIIASGGCSNTDTQAPRSEQPGRSPGAVGSGGAGTNLRSDDDFVRDVAIKNMAAVELSRLALRNAASSDIKSFAQGAIHEHEAVGGKLKNIVLGHSNAWPAALDDKYRETADELTRKQGDDFDREYVKAMIDGYQDLTAKLESRLDVQSLAEWKTAAAGRTQTKALPEPNSTLRDVRIRPDKSSSETTTTINQWAADTYPVAQKHLDTARRLENAMKERSTH